MKTNKMMRVASALLVAVLLTTCAISGTFAKYTTSVTGTDTAHVAKWGFNATTLDISGLFSSAYRYADSSSSGNSVVSSTDVIAPGTSGSTSFSFGYNSTDGAPEVAYTFAVSTDGSTCADTIKSNASIQWKLDSGDWGTWDQLIASIKALSGDASGTKTYQAGNLPTNFNASASHTISWQWLFDNSTDSTDTAMGNAADLASVTVRITITATQID